MVGFPVDAGIAGIAGIVDVISGVGPKGFGINGLPKSVVQTTSSTNGVVLVRMVVPKTTVLTFTFPGSRHFESSPKEPLGGSVLKPNWSTNDPETVRVLPAKRLGTYVASRINEPREAEVPPTVIELVLLARE